MRQHTKIMLKLVQMFLRYHDFSDFPCGNLPPGWISEWQNFIGRRKNVTIPNFVEIGSSIAEILQFSVYQNGRCCHLQFVNFYCLTVQSAKMHHCAKFRQNWSIRCGDNAIFFVFLRWRLSAIWNYRNRKISLADTVQRSRHITVPNLVKIGKSAAEILQFLEF